MLRTTVPAAAALALAAGAAAGQGAPAPDIPETGEPVAWTEVGESASALLSGTAVNRTGDPLGEIEDVLTTEEGRVYAFVLEVGDTLGVGGKRVAIPAGEAEVVEPARIEINTTPRELEARVAYDPDDVRLTMFAPIGFGAGEANEAMRTRRTYIDDWSGKVDRWSDRVAREAADLGAGARAEVEDAWSRVRDEWGDLRATSRRNWAQATDRFESAWNAFRSTWDGETGAGSADGAGGGEASSG